MTAIALPGRVLLTSDCAGGVFTYTLELAHALDEHGVEVVMPVMGRPLGREQRSALRAAPNLRVFEEPFALEWMRDPWDDVRRAGERLLEIEARTSPAVVHLNQLAFGALPFSAPKLVVGHSCVLSWSQAVGGTLGPEWRLYEERVTEGLRAADLVAAPSRAMAAALERHYGLTGVRVVPNGVDPAPFEAHTKWPFILAAGRLWDRAKNVEALAAVAGGLRWLVAIAGDDRAADGRATSWERVTPLGSISRPALARCLGHASIYAHPARYEPFGLSVLEAALCRCALVLGDIPSLRENWDGAARFVDPIDPNELVRVLEELIDSRDERARLGAAAAERARKLGSRPMAARYLGLYTELLGERAEENAACA